MPTFEIEFILDFIPSLSDMPRNVFRDFAHKLQKTVIEHEHINGIFLLSSDHQEPLIYSKSIRDFEKVKSVAELINSLSLDHLITSLAGKGYHGMEVLQFPEFSMGFVKLSDTEVLAVLITSQITMQDETKVKSILGEIKRKLLATKIEKKLLSMPNPQQITQNQSTKREDDLNVPRPGA